MTYRSDFVRSGNEVAMFTNGPYFSTIFDLQDGVYYDAVGGEIFIAQRISGHTYLMDFGDQEIIGQFKDHGFNFYLGGL